MKLPSMVRNDIWNPLPDEFPPATKSTHRFLEWPVNMTGSWCAWQVSNTTPDLDVERSGKKIGVFFKKKLLSLKIDAGKRVGFKIQNIT